MVEGFAPTGAARGESECGAAVREAEEMLVRRHFAPSLDKATAGLWQLTASRGAGGGGGGGGGGRHMCAHARCPCARLLVVAGQALFELGRGGEFMGLLLGTYGDSPVPVAVVRLAARMQRQLGREEEGADLVAVSLDRDGTSYSEEERCALFEELCRLLPPLQAIEVARAGRADVPAAWSQQLAHRLEHKTRQQSSSDKPTTPEIVAASPPAVHVAAAVTAAAPAASSGGQQRAWAAAARRQVWWWLAGAAAAAGLWRTRKRLRQVASDAFVLAFGSKQIHN